MSKTKILTICSIFLFRAYVVADICAETQHRCPESMTCCEVFNDTFGCCPFPSGHCCPDGLHCCPSNMEYDEDQHACISKTFATIYWRVPVQPELINQDHQNASLITPMDVENITSQQIVDNSFKCPDKTVCNPELTCCKILSGRYGCCPFTNGTCCQDRVHCCPHGSQCSPDSHQCFSKEMNYMTSAYSMDDKNKKLNKIQQKIRRDHHQRRKEKALSNSIEEETMSGNACPDHQSYCPSAWTCCKSGDGHYGCCPLDRATCCPDKEHCCPHGYRCNWDSCESVSDQDIWNETLTSVKDTTFQEQTKIHQLVKLEDEICPDESECDYGATCCQIETGEYGCCAYTYASCCADKKHCCPNGYRCREDASCEMIPGSPLWLLVTPFLERQFNAKRLINPRNRIF